MADIRGTSLTLNPFADATPGASTGTGHIASYTLGDTTLLFVPLGGQNALSVYTLAGDGSLTLWTTFGDVDGVPLLGADRAEVIEKDGTAFVAVSSPIENGITMFEITDSVPFLNYLGQIEDTDDPASNLDHVTSMATVSNSLGDYLITGARDSDGLSSFRVSDTGQLTFVDSIDDSEDTSYELRGAVISESFEISNFDYVLVAGASDSGLSLVRIDTFGALSVVNSFDGSSIGMTVRAAAAAIIGNDAYILAVDNQAGGSAYLLKYTPSGGFTLLETMRFPAFNNAWQVEVIEVGDQILFEVGSSGPSAAVTLVSFDPLLARLDISDRLTQAPDGDNLSTVRVSGIVEAGGNLFLPVVDGGSGNVLIFDVGAGDDDLTGTQGDDDVLGYGGDDQIAALAGDDMIDAGPGDDRVDAGSGNDVILISAGEDVTYGGSGVDTILAEQVEGGGVTIDFIRNQIILPDGTLQFVSGVENGVGTDFGDTLIGSDLDNVLDGLKGDDLMRGRGGDDKMNGDNGADAMFGAGGNDLMIGGFGTDRMNGGDGNDTMEGGGQVDSMFGGSGNDAMDGGADDDLLKGNDGNDNIGGGAGNDRLEGQTGDDLLRGNDGDDVIIGGGGRDRINAGDGEDAVTGGSAADEFVFAPKTLGGGGETIITDFQDGLDRIDLSAYAFDKAASALEGLDSSGNHTVLQLEDQIVILLDFDPNQLDETDLIL